MSTTRREFIKNTCALCASAAGLGVLMTALDSCKTTTGIQNAANKNEIKVALSSFADKNTLVVTNPSINYKILLVKKSAGEIIALQMTCTHRGNWLQLTGNELFCPSHYSTFDLDGNVTQDPAVQPLKRFPVTVNNDEVVITISRF